MYDSHVSITSLLPRVLLLGGISLTNSAGLLSLCPSSALSRAFASFAELGVDFDYFNVASLHISHVGIEKPSHKEYDASQSYQTDAQRLFDKKCRHFAPGGARTDYPCSNLF